MNLTNTTYSHFKSPLNLIPSFKTRSPCSEPQMESDNPDQLEISNVRSLSESLTDENISNQSPTETPRLKAPDLKKSFQRFPRLKLDKVFSRRLNVASEFQGSFKSKLKQLRSLSQNFAPNRTTIRKNPSKIEERIKKLNIYLTNKFLYKRYPKGSKGLKKPEQEVLDLIEIEDLEEAKVANIERVGRVTGRVDMLNYSNDSIMEHDIHEDSPSAEECTVNLNDNTNIVQGIVANSAVLEQPMVTANLVLPENTSNTTADTTNADTLNMNTEPIITVNSQSPTAADVQMNNLTDIVERETHFRLRRAFISFLCVFLGSISLTFMFENGFTHRAFFLSLYGFLIYYFIEGCKKISSHEVIDWKKVENLFNTIDIATVFFFLIIADLKLSGVISATSFATVVPLASSSLYYFSSKAPRSVLESQTITRVLFALQIFLLTARLDGNIDWPWKGVVVLFWLYLGMMVLYFILLAFMMVLMVVLSVFKINLYQNMDTKTQLIGFFWYLLYTSLSPLLFTTLIGVCDAYDHKQDFTLLHDCVLFARYFAIAAMLYTKLTHPILITFLQKFNIDEPEFRIQMRSPDSSTMTKIEIEKRDIYLVMMSSTYFLPLKQDFFLKSKENIKRCKRAIFGSGNRFLRRGYFKKKTLNQNKKQYTPITIEALRKAKEELAKRFKRSTMKKTSSSTTKKETKKGMNRIPSFNFLSFPIDWESRKVEETHKDALSVKDVESCFSEEDKEYMTNWSLNENNDMNHAQQDKGTDNLCYICVERACNAVMMKCGHGGICYECAIEFVKSKNQCMECRGVIENVVKINPNPKVKNIIKGYETTKLIGGVKHWEDE